jgi:hypothetical protein
MNGHVVNLTQGPDRVSPFAPSRKSRPAPPDSDNRVDLAGEAVLDLLGRAADAADQSSKHVLEIAHSATRQLRAAEDRIGVLEAELKHYRERADYAERWLHRIAAEIEQRFLGRPAGSDV